MLKKVLFISIMNKALTKTFTNPKYVKKSLTTDYIKYARLYILSFRQNTLVNT